MNRQPRYTLARAEGKNWDVYDGPYRLARFFVSKDHYPEIGARELALNYALELNAAEDWFPSTGEPIRELCKSSWALN